MRLGFLKAKKVLKPGSRGGRGYYDGKGEWRYGDRAVPDVHPADSRLAVQLRQQKELRFRGQRVEGAADVASAFKAMTDLDRERLWSVAVDPQQRVIAIECVSIGGLDYALADTREIIKGPAALGAATVFVVHNHPAGDPTPSMEDRHAIDRVRIAGHHLGIDVRGLVVGRRGWSEIGRVTHGSTEPTAPFHESGGHFAPLEVGAMRNTSIGVGDALDSPDALLTMMRGLYSPNERTILAVGLDNRLRVVSAQGLGIGMGAPSTPVVTGFLRSLLLNSARSVAIVAGRNGEEWSGHDGRSGLLEPWLDQLGRAAKSLRIPTVDFLVVGERGHTSLRDSRVFEALQVQDQPLLWKAGGLLRRAADRHFRPMLLKARLGTPAEPAGKVPLGKTRAGRPVFASGAESDGYSDDDHQDAAHLHAAATAHHEQLAAAHRKVAAKDDDWRRAEEHEKAADRHEALATHHFRTVRTHLVAGGHGGEAGLDVKDGAATLGAVKPHGGRSRSQAKKTLAARTHHDHPGGVTEADKAAYAKFPVPAPAAAPIAKAKAPPSADLGDCERCGKPMELVPPDFETKRCSGCGANQPHTPPAPPSSKKVLRFQRPTVGNGDA